MKNKLVSVIVPTFNSERFLERCLESVRKQAYRNIEIIVVDNYSKDRTKELAEKYGKVVLSRGIRSVARNIGAASSKGEFILSIDSDMELESNIVSECVAKAKEGFAAVIIPEISVGEGFWTNCRALEKACYVGDELMEAARFFFRTVFEEVRGYDASLEAGEDWDIHQRIKNKGYKIGRVSPYIKHIEGKLVLRKAIYKKYQYGKTLDRYVLKHPEIAEKQLSILRLAFLKNFRTLIRDPLHLAGMLLMKTCEFILNELGRIRKRA